MGEGRRFWAAVVNAGPAAAAPDRTAPEGAPAAPRDREALMAWSAAATQQFLDALREAGPDRGCWTWWDTSQSPRTAGAVARHQLHKVTVHTYDAQMTAGAPQPLPGEAALDSVEEFLSTCVATTVSWPYETAVLDFHAAEGRAWRVSLSADGAHIARLPTPGTMPTTATDQSPEVAFASARGTAVELVLVLYGRTPIDSLQLDGDRHLFELLRDWDPDS
jgi:hypothetical protein